VTTPTVSSTTAIPEVTGLPRHIAIIMDGNGRWAKKRFLPRVAGHKRGVDSVRAMVKTCGELGVEHLTLFAFSSENWRRPADEVSVLMQLFLVALQNEVTKLHENGIRFRVIGDLSPFDSRVVDLITDGEALTANNTKLTLTVAANYGGRWDILQAANTVMRQRRNVLDSAAQSAPISEAELNAAMSMADAPEPDLFIRTGGEKRISNFLLWQMAYTEMVFTDTLWPDFGREALIEAVRDYQHRERRFGRTSEQLQQQEKSQERQIQAGVVVPAQN
jgi:undecaprenyl diphosphate synthase